METYTEKKEAMPFFWAVDRLASRHVVRTVPPGQALENSPEASMLDVLMPISSDEIVETAMSTNQYYSGVSSLWSAVRPSKVYVALDALTCDVAFRHTNGFERGLALVTACHSHSAKLESTPPGVDFRLRCYVTATGSASLEVRTDSLIGEGGEERLVNVCHTTMVAVDKETKKVVKGAVPALACDAAEADAHKERESLAELHKAVRNSRAKASLKLRGPLSKPPSQEEMAGIHGLHRAFVAAAEAPAPRGELPETVGQHTHSTSFVVFPEQKNVQGTLFGGDTASKAYELAYFAAKYFMRGKPFVPIGLDDAVFLQGVEIGDMVRFTARVVHAADSVFRVFVTAEIVNPRDPHQYPNRTNNLRFVFAALPADMHTVLPQTYREILWHVDASRTHEIERRSDDFLAEIHDYLVLRSKEEVGRPR